MPDNEKITINMNAVDLGKIDLLVQEGVYTNRTDFIRSAIRAQLDKHQIEVQQSVARHSFVIGVLLYNRRDLERHRAKGEHMRLSVLGLLTLADDISPALAAEVIEAVKVRGIFQASPAVKAAIADRIS